MPFVIVRQIVRKNMGGNEFLNKNKLGKIEREKFVCLKENYYFCSDFYHGKKRDLNHKNS